MSYAGIMKQILNYRIDQKEETYHDRIKHGRNSVETFQYLKIIIIIIIIYRPIK
jgi:hypothetical protein